MNRSWKIVCIASLTCGLASAETITEIVPFDYNANDGVTFPVLQGFDSQGGTRQLTAVTFDFHHNFDVELFFESTGPTPVAAEDFSLTFIYNTLFQLGTLDGENNPPGFGIGGLFLGGISGDMAAYDGIPGNDGPDSIRRSLTDAFTASQTYTLAEPDVLAAVTDSGPLTTVLGGYNELFFEWINDPGWPFPPGGLPEYPSDAAVWVYWPTQRHYGEIEITYEYAPIPEPRMGGMALVALAALRRLARA